jgi:hypothetical protein
MSRKFLCLEGLRKKEAPLLDRDDTGVASNLTGTALGRQQNERGRQLRRPYWLKILPRATSAANPSTVTPRKVIPR